VVPIAAMMEALTGALGRAPESATPDAIANTLDSVMWIRFEAWEAWDDVALAKAIGLVATAFEGDVFVLTEASFALNLGAFLIPASYLDQLVTEHLERYGECFFNGDVVVLEASGKKLWLFHHEGAFATVQLRS
jgi:hypothetical protein